MRLFDAHCHLQDPRFTPSRTRCLTQARASGIHGWILNSTRESDWDAVDSLARKIEGALPAFGLHPWWLAERSSHWAQNLFERLSLHPSASIGETGLDRWMPNPNLADQTEVLSQHLEFAKTLQRPVTLHCLKAWPELKAILKKHLPLPAGFLLHSYAAPPEMTPFWIQANAYFSISPGLLHPRKAAHRLQFASLPLNRILLETDAPDMAPPSNKPSTPSPIQREKP